MGYPLDGGFSLQSGRQQRARQQIADQQQEPVDENDKQFLEGKLKNMDRKSRRSNKVCTHGFFTVFNIILLKLIQLKIMFRSMILTESFNPTSFQKIPHSGIWP